MEQAAAFSMNEQTLLGVSAQLRLRQGSSAQATWILEESAGGTLITIGSDATCDWQVRAAFVPARACSVLLIGGTVYVRRGPEGGVLLNGHSVGSDWTEVPNGARLDVGLARFEISTLYPERKPQRSAAPRAVDLKQTQVFGGAAQAYAEAMHHRYAEATEPRAEPTYDDSGVRANPTAHDRSGKYQRSTRGFDSVRELDSDAYPIFDEDGDRVPAVLEGEERTDRSTLWRYALAGVATACAYGGWIVLLDFL